MEGHGLVAPLLAAPTWKIEGGPGVIQHSLLPDRRHVLTKDQAGEVRLFDVVKGRVSKEFGKVSVRV